MSRTSRRRRRDRNRFVRRTMPGAPPGMLVPDPEARPSQIHVLAYGPDGHVEEHVADAAAIKPFLERWPVTWINIDGLGDTDVIADVGRLFDLHRLALEDAVHAHQRAKVEQYPGSVFVVARMPLDCPGCATEQVSLFIGRNFVVTVQETAGGDCLDPVRTRIRTGVGRIHTGSPDFLMYAILDAIIDHYFPRLEDCMERLDALEEQVLAHPDSACMAQIQGIRRDLLTIRRAVWPLREALNTLLRDPNPYVGGDVRIFLRDCHDHTIQIVDLVESYRDLAGGLADLYLSSVSQRTNEVMKVLTIISTIFIPLTFIVGVYGMNFDVSKPWNMPELRWSYGYPLVWLVMILIGAALVFFFRVRGWLTPFSPRQALPEPPRREDAEESSSS